MYLKENMSNIEVEVQDEDNIIIDDNETLNEIKSNVRHRKVVVLTNKVIVQLIKVEVISIQLQQIPM